jgi:hypothetical protein
MSEEMNKIGYDKYHYRRRNPEGYRSKTQVLPLRNIE